MRYPEGDAYGLGGTDLFAKMPPQPSVTEARLNHITTCLTVALDTLEVLSDSFNTPFLGVISTTTQSLLKYVQVTVFNEFLHLTHSEYF